MRFQVRENETFLFFKSSQSRKRYSQNHLPFLSNLWHLPSLECVRRYLRELSLSSSRYEIHKGASARESRTCPQLVSPATGCKKKKRHLWSRASEHKIEYIRNNISNHSAMETGTALGKPLKPESRWKKKKKKNILCQWRSFHIWTFFFLASSVNACLRL